LQDPTLVLEVISRCSPLLFIIVLRQKRKLKKSEASLPRCEAKKPQLRNQLQRDLSVEEHEQDRHQLSNRNKIMLDQNQT
jgi:hypothetical protein